MNELIKIKARYFLQGNKSKSRCYLFAAIVSVIYFSLSGKAFDMILSIPAVHGTLESVSPVMPNITAILLCILNSVFFTGFLSALLLSTDSIFVSNALFGKKPHDWFNFKDILKSSRLFLCLFIIRAALLAGWLALPCSLCSALLYLLRKGEMNRTFLFFCITGIAVLSAVGVFFYLLSSQDLICARFLVAAHPHLTARAAISMSRKKVRGSRFALLTFRLSFLPWLALCIFGFPVFYLWPYYRQSLACYVLAD